jgi:hypothetical protein
MEAVESTENVDETYDALPVVDATFADADSSPSLNKITGGKLLMFVLPTCSIPDEFTFTCEYAITEHIKNMAINNNFSILFIDNKQTNLQSRERDCLCYTQHIAGDLLLVSAMRCY